MFHGANRCARRLLGRVSAQPVWRLPPAAWQMRLMGAAARLWPLAVLLAGALLYLPFLSLRPLRFEEGRRVLQVMEMLDGGAWWRLKVLGEAYVNKPPFMPWLMAAAALARGTLDEAAVRLPGVLMALAGALSAGLAASRLAAADRRVAGLAGGLAFLCGLQILLKARIGETDVTATALCGLAFAAWLDGRLRGAVGPAHWLLVTVFLACAALTKGPIPVAYPALPMIALPLWRGNRREASIAFAAVAAAHVPLAAWAWGNLGNGNLVHWAVELRLKPTAETSAGLTSLLHLGELPGAVAYQLPFLPAAVAMALARRELARPRRDLVDALFLYAVPLAVLTTVLPVGQARYSMPAVWPLAVLTGLWVAMRWRSLCLAHVLVGAGVVVALIVQAVQIGLLDGRTPGQRKLRAEATQFAAALAALPPGPLPLLWRGPHVNRNLLAYAGRKLFVLEAQRLDCRMPADFLVAGLPDAPAADASGAWRAEQPLTDWGMLYKRIEAAPLRDCGPIP